MNNPNRTGWNACNINYRKIHGSLQLARKVTLHQAAYENKARGVKGLQIQMLCLCKEGTIDDGLVKHPIRDGCNVIETISVLKFPQVQGSIQLARKVTLDQIVFENKAGDLKSLKILGLSQCNEGTIGDGTMNNPNPTGCNVIETISVLKFPQVKGSLQFARKVSLDQVEYENEARGVKSLKIQAIRRCNKGTIVDGRVKNPNRTGINACNRNFREFMAHCSSQERLY